MSKDQRKTATLLDGSTIEYIETSDPPSGAMKKTYFTPDRSYVVQFFLDKKEDSSQRRARLEAILKSYNPTVSEQNGGSVGTTVEMATMFKNLFCWPTGIVVKPELGIVAPVYPSNYFFPKGNHLGAGEEKQGNWFLKPKARKHLPQDELGSTLTYLSICIKLARAVRRLHVAGLAHSDLSSKNILIDPKTGSCTIIDIDSLVVPGLFPPDVLGTPDYIAPEVLMTQSLKLGDPKKKTPNVKTDLHALAVLIYQYLFLRHPLRGPKPFPGVSAEMEEQMLMGEHALFIEHPKDHSNRPPASELKIPYTAFGKGLTHLFNQAFVDGLHNPDRRPYAMEWERELLTLWDSLYPCSNKSCELKWYVIDGQETKCPCCGTKPNLPVVRLKFSSERNGAWFSRGSLIVFHNGGVFKFHAYNGFINDGITDKRRMAYVAYHQNRWLLVNERLDTLTTKSGNLVPSGQALELSSGTTFMLSTGSTGIKVDVEYL